MFNTGGVNILNHEAMALRLSTTIDADDDMLISVPRTALTNKSQLGLSPNATLDAITPLEVAAEGYLTDEEVAKFKPNESATRGGREIPTLRSKWRHKGIFEHSMLHFAAKHNPVRNAQTLSELAFCLRALLYYIRNEKLKNIQSKAPSENIESLPHKCHR